MVDLVGARIFPFHKMQNFFRINEFHEIFYGLQDIFFTHSLCKFFQNLLTPHQNSNGSSLSMILVMVAAIHGPPEDSNYTVDEPCPDFA